MTGREHETNSVILKEPKRLFRIYFQRVVVLQCELNYPRMQNQSLPFELVALRASEFDIRGRAVLSCCVLSAFAKNQKKPAVVAAGKVFGLLGFCFYFLPLRSTQCPDWPSGEENTALCALCPRNLEINLAYGLGSQMRLSLLLHLHPSQ